VKAAGYIFSPNLQDGDMDM